MDTQSRMGKRPVIANRAKAGQQRLTQDFAGPKKVGRFLLV